MIIKWKMMTKLAIKCKTTIKLAIKWRGCARRGAPTSRGSSKVGRAPSFSNCFVTILSNVTMFCHHPEQCNNVISDIPMISMVVPYFAILSPILPSLTLPSTTHTAAIWKMKTLKKSEKWKLSNRKKILQYISLLLPYRRTRRKVREDKQRRSAAAGVADLQCLHIIYCLSERRTKTKTKNQRGQRQRDMQKKELLPNSVCRSSTAVFMRTASLSTLKIGGENPPILQV